MRNLSLFVVAIFVLCSCQEKEVAKKIDPNNWLQNAKTEEEKSNLIQKQMRGFDVNMWEVGERYVLLKEAVHQNNHELALYHWEKIKLTIENGIEKRPKRAANAKAMFLDSFHSEIKVDLQSSENKIFLSTVEKINENCKSCHNAENVSFINNQSMFENER